MISFTDPPQIERAVWIEVGPDVLNLHQLTAEFAFALIHPIGTQEFMRLSEQERFELGIQELEKCDVSKPWHTGNGVVISGCPAAGKTKLAEDLQTQLPHMEYLPSAKHFNKHYRVPFEDRHYTIEEIHKMYLVEYFYNRAKGALDMLHNIKRLKEAQKYGEDQIVNGGAMQSLIGLCAYSGQFEVDADTGELQLPENVMKVLLLTMQHWAPRFMVLVDAPLEVRKARAKEQAIEKSLEWEKRLLPFEFDDFLHSLTISTMRRLAEFAREQGQPFHLLYCPTHEDAAPFLSGFTTVPDLGAVTRYIQKHRDNTELEIHYAMMTDTRFD